MFSSLKPILALVVATSATAAFAAPFEVRYESEAPGVQLTTATFSKSGVETFNARNNGTQTYTSTFGGNSDTTGVYTNLQVNGADQYGGANGTGKYAVTFATSGYSLDLATTVAGGVNYFGYWLSALDRGNQVSFYSGAKKLFTFMPSDVIAAVNSHATTKAQYYGNPNSQFNGQNSGEPYIFLNFFANGGLTFDRVEFSENPQVGGYESDNHTVGHFLTRGTGTKVPLMDSVAAVPEPATWAMMLTGFGFVGLATRRRSTVAAA